MQVVQTRTRLPTPLITALTDCRLGFQRRRVTLCACEILLPNCGPLPQISHACAMTKTLRKETGARPLQAMPRKTTRLRQQEPSKSADLLLLEGWTWEEKGL